MAHHSCRWQLAAPAIYRHALPLRPTASHSRVFIAPFTSTSSPQTPAPPKAKSKAQRNAIGPRRGEKRTISRKKRGDVGASRGGRPAPGERKAYKKRVVLSNLNALEVPGLADLEADTVMDSSMQGTMLGLPGPLVDRLRALGSFKPTQSWNLFKRPATLIRSETVEVANMMGSEPRTQRIILTGDRGSGKSVLLLQAQAMALLKDWVVISIPEAWDVVSSRTDYGPIANTSPTRYHQKTYVRELLNRTVRANSILSTLPIESPLTRKLPHSETLETLGDLCKSADADSEQSWPIFEALWQELSLPGRPPVLLSLDGLAHAMRDSLYRSASFELIHAHDLALLHWFTAHLSGSGVLANGGLVMAATSLASTAPNRTLTERLAQLEAEQAVAAGQLHHDPAKDPMARFLAATGQESSPVPAMDPYVRYDERVLDVLGRGRGLLTTQPATAQNRSPRLPKESESSTEDTATPPTPVLTPPHILRCSSLDRPAARALMDYWARSGMLRAEVNAGLVDREWALAGGGVLGELERGVLKKQMLQA